MSWSQDNLQEYVFLSMLWGPGDGTQVVRPGSKSLETS